MLGLEKDDNVRMLFISATDWTLKQGVNK